MFLDERGQALRVSWHAEAGIVVLSIWRADHCVGTVRLGPEDARRLSRLLDDVHLAPETPQA